MLRATRVSPAEILVWIFIPIKMVSTKNQCWAVLDFQQNLPLQFQIGIVSILVPHINRIRYPVPSILQKKF